MAFGSGTIDADSDDPLIMSPQVEQLLLGDGTPLDVRGALATVTADLSEALEAGVLPTHAMPVPGIDGAYLSPLPHGLALEFHHTTTAAGTDALYLARVVRTDAYPQGC